VRAVAAPGSGRVLPAWAVVALAGTAGAVGGFATASWWWIVPAAVALVVMAWLAAPVPAALAGWSATFVVAVAAAESPGGRPIRIAVFAISAILGGGLAALVATNRARSLLRVACAAALAVAFVGAAFLPGPEFPVTGGLEPAADRAGVHDRTLEHIDDFVRDAMRARRIPGVALGIVRDDNVVLLRGYGIAGTDRSPISPETPMVMASVSKSFTALAIMQLVEDGAVRLDAPVQRYLPDFRVDHEEASAEITVRDLLQHTSGLATSSGLIVLDRPEDHSLEEDVQGAAEFEVATEPGEEFHYSNRNYQIAGRIVEVVSGQSYEEYVEEHIFEPLRMTSSAASDTGAHANGVAQGYRSWLGIPIPYGTTVITGISSTVDDMTHYLCAQLNRGRFGFERVASGRSIRLMHEPAVPTDPDRDSIEDGDAFYGLGWEIERKADRGDGSVSVSHAGTAPQYTAWMELRPEEGWGVVVLANEQAPLAHPATAIGEGVIDELLGNELPPPGDGFVVAYLIVDLLAVMVAAALVRSATRLGRWQERLSRRRAWRVVLWAVLINLVVPLFLLFWLPRVVDAWWGAVWPYAPGEVLVVGGTAFALLGLGVAKLVLAINRESPSPAPATYPS